MSASLDVRRLLTIDVDAEIRKLGRAPLGSVDQVPALLAARAIRAGAREVAVRLGPRLIEVRDDAGDLDGFRLADLAVLLSPERSPRQRHGALVSLEAAGATALLALASLAEITALRISGRGGAVLAWRRGKPPSLSEGGPRDGAHIELEGLKVSPTAARRLLADTCRFAAARVSLDGEPLPRGFREILGEAPLAAPLSGRLAIPVRSEDGAHVWLTVHGAVMAHTSLPGVLGFVAAVELGHLDLPAEPAALREAVEPLTRPLEKQALDLLVRLARRPDADPTALRDHVLRAARRRPDVPALRRLPCLPCAAARAAAPGLLSLAELESRARDGSVVALFPDQDPADFRSPPGDSVLVLDAAERSLLDRLTGLRFVTPPRRWRPTPLQRGLGALRRLLAALAGRLARLRPVRPLPDHLWSPQERALVLAVRTALRERGSSPPAPLSAGICRGGGRPRPRGDTLWLPRTSGEVRRAARALERRGPGFARVAATAVLPPE